MVRGPGITHGFPDRSANGFPAELDVCNPIDGDIAEIIKTNGKYGLHTSISTYR